MSTVTTWQTESTSSDATEKLAERLGKHLLGGEVIELVSDLGGGKTTFVRGLARGMGSSDKVASPSFTLSKVYKAGKLELHHFDFYRLDTPGVLAHELYDVLSDQQTIVIIEWGKIVEHVLPRDRLTIKITATGEHTRQLNFRYPKSLAYAMKELC